MNAPDCDIHDQADGALRQQAIENIAERIKSGKGRISIRDLLDCEMNSRGEFLLAELEQLLTVEHGEHGAKADKLVAEMIERYLSTRGDLIEEEAATIEAQAGQDA